MSTTIAAGIPILLEEEVARDRISDGRAVAHKNGGHDAASLAVVDLEAAEVLRTVTAGVGIETLSFF